MGHMMLVTSWIPKATYPDVFVAGWVDGATTDRPKLTAIRMYKFGQTTPKTHDGGVNEDLGNFSYQDSSERFIYLYEDK
jgi:hypothetical protein